MKKLLKLKKVNFLRIERIKKLYYYIFYQKEISSIN